MENLINFTKKDIDLIKSQIIPEATDGQLDLLLYQASRTGLNPLTRQIYAIFRNCKEGNSWVKRMTIQTSIDGFRVIAERSGDYAGQSEPIFTEKDDKLVSCKITVYRFRNDVRYEAAVGVAYWDEYVQKDKVGNPTRMWAEMPRVMLSKVAEALALRKAYPQDLSGLYTNDEMSQSDNSVNNSNQTPNFFKEPQGVMANLAKSAGESLEEVREMKRKDVRNKSEEKFREIKSAMEACGSFAEVEGYLESESKSIKYFEKNYKDLYDMIINCKNSLKESFAE